MSSIKFDEWNFIRCKQFVNSEIANKLLLKLQDYIVWFVMGITPKYCSDKKLIFYNY